MTPEEVLKALIKHQDQGYIDVFDSSTGSTIEIVGLKIENKEWVAIDQEGKSYQLTFLMDTFT